MKTHQLKALLWKQYTLDRRNVQAALLRIFLTPFMFILFNIGATFQVVPSENEINGEPFAARLAEQQSLASFQFNSSVIFGVSSDVDIVEATALFGSIPALESSEFQVFLAPIDERFQMLGALEASSNSIGVLLNQTSPSWEYDIFLPIGIQPDLSFEVEFLEVSSEALESEIASLKFAIDLGILQQSGVDISQDLFLESLPKKVALVEEQDSEGFLVWSFAFNIALALQFGLGMLLNVMVIEKRDQLKRSFLLIGVPKAIYSLHWLVYITLCSLVSSLLLVILTIFMNVLVYTNPIILYIYWLFVQVGLGAWTVVVAEYVNSTDVAGVVNFFVCFGFILGYIPIALSLDSIPYILRFIIASSHPLLAAIDGFIVLRANDFQALELGIGFSEFLVLFATLLISTFLYSFLALFYAPGTSIRKNILELFSSTSVNVDDVEKGDPVSIKIQNISKQYPGEDTFALSNVQLDLSAGRVHGLVGHNGSGKTTLASILSTELKPSEGNIFYQFSGVSGLLSDLKLNELKRNIGICTQHNLLVESLTGRQNLELFVRLKGVCAGIKSKRERNQAVTDEVHRLLSLLNPDRDQSEVDVDFADKEVSNYSGGMKRKLQLLISLVGDPDLWILDEPTAGIDVGSKKVIQELILSVKQEKCILLTTHFMEECDLLSDLLVILRKGEIVTTGTSLELKHKYGAGYSLVFSLPSDDSVTDKLQALAQGLDELVDDLKIESNPEKEGFYSIKLGHTESRFPDILAVTQEIQAENVDIQLTTLTEVFLKVAVEHEATTNDVDTDVVLQQHSEMNFMSSTASDPQTSCCSVASRIHKIGVALVREQLGDKAGFYLGSVLPLFLVLIAFVLESGRDPSIDEEDLDEFFTVSELNEGIFDQKNNVSIFLSEELEPFFCVDALFPNLKLESFEIDSFLNLDDEFDEVRGRVVGGVTGNKISFNLNADISPLLMESVTTNLLLAQTTSCEEDQASVKTSFVEIVVGDVSEDDFSEFNILNLLVPLFINSSLLTLAYSLLLIVVIKGNGTFHYFKLLGLTKMNIYLAIVDSKVLVTLLPTMFVSIVGGLAVQSALMGDQYRWLVFISLMIIYAYAVIPLGLLFEVFFKSKEVVENVFPIAYSILNISPFIVFFVFNSIEGEEDTAELIRSIFLFFPGFAAQFAMLNLLIFSEVADVLEARIDGFDDQDYRDVLYSKDSLIVEALYVMAATGTFFWFLLYFHINGIPSCFLKTDIVPSEKKEENMSFLEAIQLTKTYKVKENDNSQKKTEVEIVANQDVSFSIDKSEIFTLIGQTGAGKSTSIGVVIGDVVPDKGAVYVDNTFLAKHNMMSIFQRNYYGYCPQFDIHFDYLTLQQHFQLIADLRGIKIPTTFFKDMKANLEAGYLRDLQILINETHLTEHLTKRVSNLSGGMKRKFSFILSMIGSPVLRVLDEPSTGLDPNAKETLWRILKGLTKVKPDYEPPAVLLSTHDMSEAENISTKIGIMAKGELIASGTTEDLIQQHCTNLNIEVVFDGDSKELLSTLNDKFSNLEVLEESIGKLRLKVPFSTGESKSEQLGDAFGFLEEIKRSGALKFYSIRQMNLEQVFLTLIKED